MWPLCRQLSSPPPAGSRRADARRPPQAVTPLPVDRRPSCPQLDSRPRSPGPGRSTMGGVRIPDQRMPFVGSRALAEGRLTPYELRSSHRRVFPDVYVPDAGPLEPRILVHAAFLWAPPGSVIGGLGAALLHRERWYAPEAVPREIDVYSVGTPRPAPGVRLRRLGRHLPDGHVVTIGGVRVTAAARTAVDVGRWEDDDDTAIAKIDSICRRARTDPHSIVGVADQMARAHGVRRVRKLLRWCDARADSPRETWLRLLLTRAGLPAPVPQLVIRNEFGAKIATADLGYEEQKVAIFYDSELHRQKSNWEFDAWVNAQLIERGWLPLRVTAQMMRSPLMVVRQVGAALRR